MPRSLIMYKQTCPARALQKVGKLFHSYHEVCIVSSPPCPARFRSRPLPLPPSRRGRGAVFCSENRRSQTSSLGWNGGCWLQLWWRKGSKGLIWTMSCFKSKILGWHHRSRIYRCHPGCHMEIQNWSKRVETKSFRFGVGFSSMGCSVLEACPASGGPSPRGAAPARRRNWSHNKTRIRILAGLPALLGRARTCNLPNNTV